MFITSYHDKQKDKIIVWEKVGDQRIIKRYDPPRYFYVPDKLGDYEAITGEKLKKLTFRDRFSYDEACRDHSVKFESDLHPLEKLMQDQYYGKPAPTLTIGFVDIEVDYDPDVGFPRPSNPYAPVNALTLYRTDLRSYFSILVPPPGWIGSLPQEMIDDNYIIVNDERELFEIFFELLIDVDLISGWNSDFFDLPYLGKRAELLFGKDGLQKFAFEQGPPPAWGEQERFKGAKEKDIVLNIGSRVHLDYMRVFKKFNLEGRQSFSLAAIADDELHIPKLNYHGTLYELYHGTYKPNLKSLIPDEEQNELYRACVDRAILANEIEDGHGASDIVEAYKSLDTLVKQLSFIKFGTYNRRDVEVLVEIDKKFKYIELASQMVHEATVNFHAIFGSVQLIDSAIINYCHSVLKKIVFDRKHKPGTKVEGALVMNPKVGLSRMIGSCDINSLYPSTYRSLNLSPEKIVGQLLEYEDGWRAIYDAVLHPDDDLRQNKIVNLLFEGSSFDDAISLTAGDVIELLRDKKFALSAYGTILDQGNGEGLLPSVLTYWFKGRKELQAKKKEHNKNAKQILEQGIQLTSEQVEELEQLLSSSYEA